MANQVKDTFNSGTRGTPNAWSPSVSDQNNWLQATGTATLGFTGTTGTLTGSTAVSILLLQSPNGNIKPFYYADITGNVTKVTVGDGAGVVARFIDASNYYRASFSNGIFAIRAVVAGVVTTLGTYSFTEHAATKYSLHLRVSGQKSNTLQANIWTAGTSEPSGFQITVTNDTSILSPGQSGIYHNAATTGHVLSYDTFAAADPPSYTSQVGDNPYGLNIINNPATTVQGAQAVRDAVNARYGWIRWILNWLNVETSPGVYDWTVPDQIVSSVTGVGLNLLFSVTGAPSFHKILACPGSSSYQVMDPVACATFIGLLAARYNQSSAIGFVAAIELGNEAYEQGYLNCPPGSVAAILLQNCYPAIKAQSPTTLVGCAASYMNTNLTPWWFGSFLTAGGGSFIDFLNIHYYPSGGPNDPVTAPVQTLGDGWHLVQTTANTNGYFGPIWITENGWSNTVPEATQSLYYQQALDIGRTSNGGIAKHFWFETGSITTNTGPQERFRQAYLMLQSYTVQYPTWPITYPPGVHLPATNRRSGSGLTTKRRDGTGSSGKRRDGVGATGIRRDGVSSGSKRRSGSAFPVTQRRG